MSDRVHLENARWQVRLELSPLDFGLSLAATPAEYAAAVTAYQRNKGLVADGIAGPATFRAIREDEYLRLRCEMLAAPGDARLEVAGRITICKLHWLWANRIQDPPDASAKWSASRKWIDDIFRTPAGINWHWEPPYVVDGDNLWCGATAAWGWAWPGLPADLRQDYWASTWRLDRWARYLRIRPDLANAPPPAGGPRRLHVEYRKTDTRCPDARAGDVLLVGDGRPSYGDHVAVVERIIRLGDCDVICTLEGNASGLGPDGVGFEGVVRCRRPMGQRGPGGYWPMRLVRPALTDLVIV